jgi:hypothetical protein
MGLGDHIPALIALSTRVIEEKTEDDHFLAVQAEIAVAAEIYKGILQVCQYQNGMAGEALLRTLFEVVTTAIILAKDKNKLKDFFGHARYTELRIIRTIEEPELRKRLEPTIIATENEYQGLLKEFEYKSWHKMKTKQSFIEAEFQPSFYDKYYRRASAIAHGQPYATVRNGKSAARPSAWRTMAIGAVNMASMMMSNLLAITNREFKLNLENELAVVAGGADADARKHMQLVRNAIGR